MAPGNTVPTFAAIGGWERATSGKILVTTLLCPKHTPNAALKTLYRERRHVELDLRQIKTTLGMESVRCKTPAIAQKKILVYLLAYNLIRLMMAQAAVLAANVKLQTYTAALDRLGPSGGHQPRQQPL